MKKIFLLFLILFGNLKSCEVGSIYDDRLSSEDIKIVQEAIREGADINSKDKGGYTPLMRAIMNKRIAIAKLLINLGADVNAKKLDGSTALMLAAYNGSYDCCKSLIEAEADVNAKNSYGNTALMEAVRERDAEKIIKLLIDSGADLDAQNRNGITALMFSIIANNPRAAKLLISAGADINIKDYERGFTALKYATLKREFGFTHIPDLIRSQMKKFTDAAYEGDIKTLMCLIEQGANINTQDGEGFTALMRAAQGSIDPEQAKRKLEIIKILLEKGANYELKDKVMKFTALKWAKEFENTQAEALLKAAGARE